MVLSVLCNFSLMSVILILKPTLLFLRKNDSMKQLFNVTARLIDVILMELCGTAERVNGISISWHQLHHSDLVYSWDFLTIIKKIKNK